MRVNSPVAQPKADPVTDDVTLVPTELDPEGMASNGSTTVNGSSEADDWKAKFEQQQSAFQQFQEKHNNDINQLKSSLQKQTSTQANEFQRKEREYQERIQQLQLATMPEEQKAQYMQELNANRWEEMQSELSKQQQTNQELQAIVAWRNFFISEGVAPKDLNGDNVNDLMTSGWSAISAENKRLRGQLDNLMKKNPTTVSKDQKVRAPGISQSIPSNTIPTAKPTLAELAKKFGSLENVFKAIETGQLNPDVLPIESK
jgi:hypothetical protein